MAVRQGSTLSASIVSTLKERIIGWQYPPEHRMTEEALCREFGVNSWQDEGLLTHSLHTVIIDRQGRIAANMEGNEYTAQQLGDLAEAVMARR